MDYKLIFPIKYQFKTTEIGVTIPFSLKLNERKVDGRAKVDTGSEFCLFQREIADELGIEVEDGFPLSITTLSGGFTTYAHTVQINTLGIVFESTVLFTPSYGVPRNILGRRGWLENLRLALTMDDETIYLKSIYSSENL